MEKIIVTVQGGLVQDVSGIPKGVEVEVLDFDCEKTPEQDDRVHVIDGENVFVSKWTSLIEKRKFEVIVQEVRFYRGFVLAVSDEEAKRMIESGEAGADWREYANPERTVGEIRNEAGETVWERS